MSMDFHLAVGVFIWVGLIEMINDRGNLFGVVLVWILDAAVRFPEHGRRLVIRSPDLVSVDTTRCESI